MLVWSGKIYGHGRGKSRNLILHKEWEPCTLSGELSACEKVKLFPVLKTKLLHQRGLESGASNAGFRNPGSYTKKHGGFFLGKPT